MESSSKLADNSSNILIQGPENEQSDDKIDNFYSPYNRDFYTAHSYTTLDASRQEIRVLRINTDESQLGTSTPIRCELLENIPLADIRGKFTAISYCAGDPKEIESVMVNGVSFNAFARLGHALRQARHFWNEKFGDRECLLWADQICINQSDPVERSNQVGLMGEIYGAAQQTFISLTKEGDASGGSAWLERVYNVRGKNRNRSLPGGDEDDLELHRRFKLFLQTVVYTPYWSRAWVRQEYFLSCRVHLLAAFESLEEDRLDEFIFARANFRRARQFRCTLGADFGLCSACLYSQRFSHRHLEKFKIIEDFLSMRSLIRKRKPNSNLMYCLREAKLCKSSDPRDLIYAFLGLSNDNFGISADYSSEISFPDICLRLTQNMITRYNNLDVLLASIPLLDEGMILDCPSWGLKIQSLRTEAILSTKNDSYTQQVARFLPDDQGRIDKILQVRGYPYQIVSKQTEDDESDTENDIGPIYGQYCRSDEIWWLYGSTDAFILRRHAQNHELVGTWDLNRGAGGAGRRRLVQARLEFLRMAQMDDPPFQTINIC